jgi:hypothetical protein
MSAKRLCPAGCAYDEDRGIWVVKAHNCVQHHYDANTGMPRIHPEPDVGAPLAFQIGPVVCGYISPSRDRSQEKGIQLIFEQARKRGVPYCRIGPGIACSECPASEKTVGFHGFLHRCRWCYVRSTPESGHPHAGGALR